jgi:hypothetical protein
MRHRRKNMRVYSYDSGVVHELLASVPGPLWRYIGRSPVHVQRVYAAVRQNDAQALLEALVGAAVMFLARKQ